MEGRSRSAVLAGILSFLWSTNSPANQCITPGQSFECAGFDCQITGGIESGQQHDVIEEENRLRVRAVDSNLGNPSSSYAELYAVVVEPQSDLFLRANANIRYAGFLAGVGGGPLNFGAIEVDAVVRDLGNDELVASQRIVRGVNDGDLANGPAAFENLFGPPALRDVPFEEGEGVFLQAGRTYGIGIGARAEARGGAINNGVSNYFTANNGVFLNTLSLITWADTSNAAFADDDGDGLPNVWETDGIVDCLGNMLLDLPGFGADPMHKDLFWELDWTSGREPRAEAIQAVKAAFAAAPVGAGGSDNPDGMPGINIWIDTGSLTDDSGSLVGDNLGGGNPIPMSDIPDPGGQFIPPLSDGALGKEYEIDIDGNGRRDFYEVKERNFSLARQNIFRYSASLEDRDDDDNDYPGGQAERGGDDSALFSFKPGTMMHEFGHNLGLRHGGGDNVNCKPNYVSVMNYQLSGGIPRRSQDAQAQDVDNDGNIEPRILDYSPPRRPGGRGAAPIFGLDDGLVEATLSENRELDEDDAFNVTRYYNPDGDGRDLKLDEAPDWNDDGENEADFPSVNINFNEDRAGCNDPEEQSFSELQGHDDWAVIQLSMAVDGIIESVAENQNDSTPEPEEDDPDDNDLRDIEEPFNTLDLGLTKSVEPELVMAGQVLRYDLTVTNNGPNAALEVVVEDTLPEFVTPVDLPDSCQLGDEGLVTCFMDVIDEGESAILSLHAQVAPRLPCGAADTFPLRNLATVRNGDWIDTNSDNNEATAESQALCLRFEYAAKFVCGERIGNVSMLVASGRYGTIVNIHNHQSRRLPFFKKLAVAFPPVEQMQGDVYPIGIDELDYDHALKTDCDDISRNLFDGQLPEGFIDGYLVVQAPRRLDVDAFYSAGSTGQSGEIQAPGIHVLEVSERDLRTDISIDKFADVFPFPSGLLPDQLRLFAVRYTVRVSNGGAIHGEALRIADRLELVTAGQVAGAFVIPEDPFVIPESATRTPVALNDDLLSATFSVELEEIAPDDTVEVQFWALVLTYVSNTGEPTGGATLVDIANVESQGPDQTLTDNKVEVLTPLIELD